MRWRSSKPRRATAAVLCNSMETITIAPPEEQSSSSPALPSRPKSSWIYGPWIDLTVGCGAWSAPLLLAGFYFANSYQRGWSVAFYFLALLSNYPHFMATVYRAYHTRDEFEKYRVVYGACRAAARCGRSRHAPLVCAASMDLHALHLLEPVALHADKISDC